jgi:hypothetical protein
MTHPEKGKSKRSMQPAGHLNVSPAIQALYALITVVSSEI